MNTATRVSQQPISLRDKGKTAVFTLPSMGIGLLLLCVIVSAFALVYVRDYQRQLITQLQGLQMTHDNMMTQRSQLLLEQAAWSTQGRIQNIAEQKLHMTFPSQQTIIALDS